MNAKREAPRTSILNLVLRELTDEKSCIADVVASRDLTKLSRKSASTPRSC